MLEGKDRTGVPAGERLTHSNSRMRLEAPMTPRQRHDARMAAPRLSLCVASASTESMTSEISISS